MNITNRLDNINAVQLYQSGATLCQIGKLAQCNETTVASFLHNHGVPSRNRGIANKIHPVNTIIGNWKVLCTDTVANGKHCGVKQWCECIVCGNRMYVYLNKKTTAQSRRCNKCKSSKVIRDDGTIDVTYVIYCYFRLLKKNISRRDKVNKLKFSITPEYLEKLYWEQDGKCALSGINLIGKSIALADLPLSLDRIDSNIGYVEGNVQWVHKDINMMKQSFSNERFVGICCQVAMYHAFSVPHDTVYKYISINDCK